MRIYFERLLICSKCGEQERQTATRLPMDWIGKSLDEMQRKDFIRKHNRDKFCSYNVHYSSWKIGRWNSKDDY